MVLITPPFLLVLKLPLDSCHHLEVPIPHLELGFALLSRKKVDPVLGVPKIAHRLLP